MATTWDSANSGSNITLTTGDTFASGGPGVARSTTALPINSFVQVCEVRADYDPTLPENTIHCGFVTDSANVENNPGDDQHGWALTFVWSYDDAGDDIYDVYYRHNGVDNFAGEYRVDVDPQESRTFYFAVAVGNGKIEGYVGAASVDGMGRRKGFSISAGTDDLLGTHEVYVAFGNNEQEAEINPEGFTGMDYAQNVWPGGYAWDDIPRIIAEHLQPIVYAPTVFGEHLQPAAYGIIAEHLQPIDYVPTVFGEHLQPVAHAVEMLHAQPVAYGVPITHSQHAQPIDYGNPTVFGEHLQPVTHFVESEHAQPVVYAPERIFTVHAQSVGYGESVESEHAQPVVYAAGNPRLFTEHAQPAPMLGEPPTIVTGQPTLKLGNRTIEIASARIHADDGSPFWQADIELADPRDYGRLPRDTAILLDLYGTEYSLIVDTRQLERGMSVAGTPGDGASLTALSPGAAFANPRALAITQTWETATGARAAVQSLIGAIDWQIIDWSIPAFRLAAQGATPLDVAQQIINAPGGILLSKPDGALLARPLFPANPAGFDTATPAVTLTDFDIFTAAETVSAEQLVNRVRIVDVDASYQDRLEFESDEDNPLRGTVFAYPSPWDAHVTLCDTRGDPVRVYPGSVHSRQETETIEIQAGRASVRYPIRSVEAVVYLDDSLGGVSFEQGTSDIFTDNDGWSLMQITYTTRAIVAMAESEITTRAQILLERSV